MQVRQDTAPYSIYVAICTWLKERYDNDIDKLNNAYWSSFWSHTFPDWDYVIPTDEGIHGLILDWMRFKTVQTIDFFKTETSPLKEITPGVPVTTNFMTGSSTLDYWAFAREVDVISWDSYPPWHETGDDREVGAQTALMHDINRAMKGGKPFMLMESVPNTRCRFFEVIRASRPCPSFQEATAGAPHLGKQVYLFAVESNFSFAIR